VARSTPNIEQGISKDEGGRWHKSGEAGNRKSSIVNQKSAMIRG
jgi:hypothetical protein